MGKCVEGYNVMKKAAGIVTYNPDIHTLKKNILAIRSQVDMLILCDNHSKNISTIEQLATQYSIKIIKLNDNKGIAFALNQILKKSKENDVEWLITLDQDSFALPGLVDNYMKYINESSVISMICDWCRQDEVDSFKIEEEGYSIIKECYTSGNFIKVDEVINLGGFDEKMFIDYVDFDLCATIRENYYRIIKINYLGLIHEVGKTKEKKLFGKKIYLYNHAPRRKYYQSRNGIYFARKHSKYFGKKWAIKKKLSVIKKILLTFIFESQKKEKLKMSMKGIKEGMQMSIKDSNK